MKKKKLLFYIGFFILLLAGFYYFTFRNYDFSDSRLPVINANIPSFHFIDQDGQVITDKATRDKVYVADYFFTTCKGICPRMNANMRRVYDAYKDKKDFLILSHTCMPETDSVPVLKKYEERMLGGKLERRSDGSYRVIQNGAPAPYKNDNWYFLTGPKDKLYEIARSGYLIDNGKPDSTQMAKDDFMHTQFFALVDRYGRVRGIYDGLRESEVNKLIHDIADLLGEKIDHDRFISNPANAKN